MRFNELELLSVSQVGISWYSPWGEL